MKTFNFHLLIFVSLCFISSVAGAQEKTKAEKPYTIYERTNKISRADIRKDNRGADNIIQIDATNASGGAGMMTRAPLPPAEITGVMLISGSYNMTRELAKSGRGMSMQLLDVVFPCRVRATVSGETFDFEIKEKGFWKVSLALIN